MKKIELHSKISDLISMIYDSALEPELWSVFLSEIRTLTNSKSTCVYFDPPSSEIPILIDDGIDPAAMVQYFDYYHKLDSCFTFTEEHANFDRFYSTVKSLPDKKSLISAIGEEYYHDFHIKELNCDEMVCCVLDPKSGGSFVALHKAIGQPIVDDSTLLALQQLVPHIQRAQVISNKLNGLSRLNNALYESMQHLKQGIILFDSLAMPLFINVSAENMIARHPLLGISNKGVECQSQIEHAKLNQLLTKTILTRFGENTSGGGSLLIGKDGESKPLSIMITPVSFTETNYISLPNSVCAMMMINDTGEEVTANEELLAEYYGLTPTETRVAILIANGKSLDEIAATNKNSIHTIRNQLKSVFSKTDTHRQTELVKLVLGLSIAAGNGFD